MTDTRLVGKRRARAAAMVVTTIGLAVLMLVPPATRVALPLAGGSPTARGAYHIHSDRSDGSGTVDEIARAAQRAGLQFMIVTDHGDGTRQPDPPAYRHGVLVIDAVELNTAGGHLVALGLPVTPYPFAGEAADVLEDVHRLRAFGIAAHPDSPRPGLRWGAWNVPVDGLEWVNADSDWRDERAASLARALIGYLFRPAGAIAMLLDRPVDLLARWDAMSLTRPVPALAAADAHARVGADDPEPSAMHMPLPGYEAAFRAFSNHVVLHQPLTGNAALDAAAVLTATRGGRTFTVVDALASPGALAFTAIADGTLAHMGDAVSLNAGVVLRAQVSGPPGTTLRLLRNGVVVQSISDAELSWRASEAGVYRVEADLRDGPGTPPVPWILSNPIYVGLAPRTFGVIGNHVAPISRIPARSEEAATEKGSADVSELVAVQQAGGRERRLAGEPPIGWRFGLSPGVPAGQFAAVRLPIAGGLAAFDRVRFQVTAAAPVRAWVQMRGGAATERWGRTFYADAETRVVDLPLESFLPIGATSSAAPPLGQIDALLFVVDTLNSRPGASGSMTIADVAFVR